MRKASPYITFNRKMWQGLRMNMPLEISESDLDRIHGVNEKITLEEISEIYLPISRLLNMYVTNTQWLYSSTNAFLGTLTKKVPYVIGIAGSVAVGKSTVARVIQELVKGWPTRPKVDLVSTDDFLYPNAVLEERGIMSRKGFPESYDTENLLNFLQAMKSGRSNITTPIYSHVAYDILPDQCKKIRVPDILIVEGLNILQSPKLEEDTFLYISDFIDFSIYVHADEKRLKQWYLNRFKTLRETAFQDKEAYFYKYTKLSEEESVKRAMNIWNTINSVNLKENILPTMKRARLVLKKGEGHKVEEIYLRKL